MRVSFSAALALLLVCSCLCMADELYFDATLKTQGSCTNEAGNVLRCDVPEGAAAVLQLSAEVRLTSGDTGYVVIGGQVPAGWPAFAGCTGHGQAACSYAFTVPTGQTGVAQELQFTAQSGKMTVQLTVVIIPKKATSWGATLLPVPIETGFGFLGIPIDLIGSSCEGTTDAAGNFIVFVPVANASVSGTAHAGLLLPINTTRAYTGGFTLDHKKVNVTPIDKKGQPIEQPKGGSTTSADVGGFVVETPGFLPLTVTEFATLSSPFGTMYLLGTITFEPDPCANGPAFQDPQLESAVRKALGIADGQKIGAEDIQKLTSLDVPNLGIRDLHGLECAVHLKTLDIRNNAVQDLSPLQSLAEFESLYAAHNSIAKFGGLASQKLGCLELSQNALTEFTTGNWPELRILNLEDNQIADITWGWSLPSLVSAWFARNPQSEAELSASVCFLAEARLFPSLKRVSLPTVDGTPSESLSTCLRTLRNRGVDVQ